MKTKLRYLLVISAVCFWVSFAVQQIANITLFLLFGICSGLLIAKVQPLSLLLGQKRARNTILLLAAVAVSAVFCIYAGLYFYYTWSGSVMLERLIARFTTHYERALIGITAVVTLGMFPAVFDVISRLMLHAWRMVRSIHFLSLWTYAKQALSAKTVLKNIVLVTFSLILAAAIGIGLLTAVYLLPVEQIEQNVDRSALIIQEEGTYKEISSWFYSRLDNWTDSITLMEAATGPETTALEAAVNVTHGSIVGATPADTLVAHYIDGEPYDSIVEYSRYWHGYLLLIKPLLCFMDYQAIRILNGIVQLLFVATICFLLYQKKLSAYIPSVVLVYLSLMPVALACSIQFSTCFYIIMASLLVLLLINKQKLDRFAGLLFLCIGMATSYFDFWTYPIATFGIPICLLLLLMSTSDLEQKLLQIVKCGIFWCIGFGGFLVSKWVISYLVCGYDFSKILSLLDVRTSMTDASGVVSLYQIEMLNYTTFLKTPITVLSIYFIGKKMCANKSDSDLWNQTLYRAVLPYLLVALAPVVWFAFAGNHSAIHYSFTNKACAVTLFAVLLSAITVYGLKKTKADNA